MIYCFIEIKQRPLYIFVKTNEKTVFNITSINEIKVVKIN